MRLDDESAIFEKISSRWDNVCFGTFDVDNQCCKWAEFGVQIVQ